MCLAIPAQIVEMVSDGMAIIDTLGTKRKISLDLVPSANVGDYVLVHAGFAIEVVSVKDAQESLEVIKQMPEFANVVL